MRSRSRCRSSPPRGRRSRTPCDRSSHLPRSAGASARRAVRTSSEYRISRAFFRFYFDAKADPERLTVIRTSFWFTMATSTLGLVLGLVFASAIGHWIGLGHDPSLVRAGAVGLWAQTN